MATVAAPPGAPPAPLLDVKTPTPSDIDIAQSVQPKHISLIAEAKLGLQPEEYELHGPHKAKARRRARARTRMQGASLQRAWDPCAARPSMRRRGGAARADPFASSLSPSLC